MSTTTNISDLPDYPAIKKLASALHRHDANHHGAAIMVGAGFSRSAARHVGGNKRVPLWTDFTKKLAQDLYGADKTLSFADPLRVAEEYRAYFGQAALNDRIRLEVDDDAWQVGPLYKSLLTLPWSDVLTTNWDTLLERAANDIHSPYYTPVTKAPDLAWAQAPRIVKLHGTIGVTETFIAAQEDYRTYPERFAPFVNLARQVFIENELCLLGFSGDDPNFLQWAGWVRDHLASHARKIYLVGALNLSVARRKQLESTNVAPIDLFPAVAHITDRDLRHQAAIEIFLQELRNQETSSVKPYNWQPSNLSTAAVSAEEHGRLYRDSKLGAKLLASQLEVLQRDRMSYPGWLFCPPSLHNRLANQISNPFPTPENLAELAPGDRAKLLYEIAWRHGVTFEHIAPWLEDVLFNLAQQGQPCAISEQQQAEIALVLLNNARWQTAENDERQRHIDERTAALIAMLEKNAYHLPDCAAEIAYHRALVARDKLDYGSLADIVTDISGEDPVWKLRKAALLSELGHSDEAVQLLAQACRTLREHHRRDRQSISVMSRLLWAHWLMSAVQRASFSEMSEDLPVFVENNYRKWKCDPWTSLDTLRNLIESRRENYLKRRNPIEPQFEQGHYRDLSDDFENNDDASDFLFLDGLSRTCGVPLRFDVRGMSINLLKDNAQNIVLHGGIGDELLNLTLTIRSATSDTSPEIKEVFGRINVATYSQRSIDIMVPRILSAVRYWQRERIKMIGERQQVGLSKLRVLLEVLARLSVRVPPIQAQELFVLATELGKLPELQHSWLSDALDSVLTKSLASIPASSQGEFLIAALEFPLRSEVVGAHVENWPNPVIKHPGDRPRSSSALEKRIDQLIDAVRVAPKVSRTASLLRLLPLASESFLTDDERTKLADAVWGEQAQYATLPETGLFPHALLILPTRDVGKAEEVIRSKLYDHNPEILADAQKEQRIFPSPNITLANTVYRAIANAATDADLPARLLPSAKQAAALFGLFVISCGTQHSQCSPGC
ncbi:SIR2 family protein [Burkholderia multivorans]|uniref:SIR2 family protein n=1 Tax=Burkholderia multivorans TaxID=87883 RepID=UPI001C23A9DA|nr:SIR2 family protein [Burkholderia multivorans]MBU9556744.1 SIR2 family protein [Burkholderia multivorans]